MFTVFGKPLQSSEILFRRKSTILNLFKFDKILKYVAMSSGGPPGAYPAQPVFVHPSGPSTSERKVTYAPQQPGGHPHNNTDREQGRRTEKRVRSGSKSRSRSRDKQQSGGSREGPGGYNSQGQQSRSFGRGRGNLAVQPDHESFGYDRERGQHRGGYQQNNRNQDSNSGRWQSHGHQGQPNRGGNWNPAQQYSRNESGEWSEEDYTFLSRTLSSILRHNAEKFGFKLMKGGFLYVDDIVHKVQKLHGFTLQDVQKVVAENDKKRFALEKEADGRWKIRANQGHSLEVECLDLKPITSADDVPSVIHGTYFAAWEMIKNTGLRKMNRNHIHFAAGEPGNTGVISGMRSSCQVIIRINLEKALKDGLKFLVSANNVILSEGNEDGIIYPCYFEGAMDRKRRCRLDFDDSIGKTTEPEPKKKKKKNKKNKQPNEAMFEDQEADSCVTMEETPDPVTKKEEEDATKNEDSAVTQEPIETSKPEPEEKIFSKSPEDTNGRAVTQEPIETSKPEPEEKVVSKSPEDTNGNCSQPADTIPHALVDKDYGNDEKDEDMDSDTEAKEHWEDCEDGAETDEILEWSFPKFMNADQSVDTVEKLLANPPSFVAVCCVGENLGKKEGCIRAIVVLVYPDIYVYHLCDDNKDLVKEGKLDTLLLHKDIHKVFFNIGVVSRALIHEYAILMNRTPIWDIELMYKMVKLANMDMEYLKQKYQFDGKFKNWNSENETCGSSLKRPDIDQDSLHQVIKKGKCIAELYGMCKEKMNDDCRRKLRTETYKVAIPFDEKDDSELIKKVEELKLLTSSKKQKKANKDTETAQQQQEQENKQEKKKGGKQQHGGGGGGNKRKGGKGNKR